MTASVFELSVQDAVVWLREQPSESIDLLITDFAMPGMTGAQLAEEARRVIPNLPVLLATGYAELPDGSGLALPRIGKPFTQAQLAQEIAKLAG